jgi:hypothetical protein
VAWKSAAPPGGWLPEARPQIGPPLAAWTWPDLVEAKVPPLTNKSFWHIWVPSDHVNALPDFVMDFESYARRWERSK